MREVRNSRRGSCKDRVWYGLVLAFICAAGSGTVPPVTAGVVCQQFLYEGPGTLYCDDLIYRARGVATLFEAEGPVTPFVQDWPVAAGMASGVRIARKAGRRGGLLASNRAIRQLHFLPLLYPLLKRR